MGIWRGLSRSRPAHGSDTTPWGMGGPGTRPHGRATADDHRSGEGESPGGSGDIDSGTLEAVTGLGPRRRRQRPSDTGLGSGAARNRRGGSPRSSGGRPARGEPARSSGKSPADRPLHPHIGGTSGRRRRRAGVVAELAGRVAWCPVPSRPWAPRWPTHRSAVGTERCQRSATKSWARHDRPAGSSRASAGAPDPGARAVAAHNCSTPRSEVVVMVERARRTRAPRSSHPAHTSRASRAFSAGGKRSQGPGRWRPPARSGRPAGPAWRPCPDRYAGDPPRT